MLKFAKASDKLVYDAAAWSECFFPGGTRRIVDVVDDGALEASLCTPVPEKPECELLGVLALAKLAKFELDDLFAFDGDDEVDASRNGCGELAPRVSRDDEEPPRGVTGSD